jgi:hypothetical protein
MKFQISDWCEKNLQDFFALVIFSPDQKLFLEYSDHWSNVFISQVQMFVPSIKICLFEFTNLQEQ